MEMVELELRTLRSRASFLKVDNQRHRLAAGRSYTEAEEERTRAEALRERASWGIQADGLLWHQFAKKASPLAWSKGDVIGLAVDVDAGKMAVSKNGSWSDAGCGVVFVDDKIRAGVYPTLAANKGKLRHRFAAPFQFGPPPPEVWEGRA